MTDTDDSGRYFETGDECSTRGVQALHKGDVDEGHEWFRKAIEAYQTALADAPPDDPVITGNLKLCIGARLSGLGRLDEALAHVEEVLGSLEGREALTAEGDGLDLLAQAKLNRAEIRLTEGNRDAAAAEVEEVAAIAPGHPYAEFLRERIDNT